jgi:aspartate aminotransferase
VDVIEQAVKIQQYNLACPASISQYAALEAYTGPQDSVDAMKREYAARRDLLISGLRELGISVNRPDGAFYAFPEIDEDTVRGIVDKGVIITPGTAFGSRGRGYARMSYATSQANILTALERIRSVILS